MSRLSDMLFGKKPSTQQVTQSTMDPAQQQLMNNLIRAMSGGMGGAPTSLSGTQQTSLAALEQFAMNMANPQEQKTEGDFALGRELGKSGSYTPDFSSANFGMDMIAGAAGSKVNPNLDRSMIEALGGIASTTGPAFDEFYRTNVAMPLYQDFQENVIPMLDRKFGGADFFSSDRLAAAQDATDELINALVRGRNDTLLKARDQSITAAGKAGDLSLGSDRVLIDALLGQRGQDIQAGSAVGSLGMDQATLLANSFLTGRGQNLQAAGALDQVMTQDSNQDQDAALKSLVALFEMGGAQNAMQTAERDKMLQALLAVLGTKTRDNTVVAQPGQAGLLQGFLGGASSGLGAGLASLLFL